MKNEVMQFPQQMLRQIKCLRKISPNDRFPCFNCFDDRLQKISCKVCGGCGFVYGSHPMVQFSQDFIQKKINYLKKQQQNNTKLLSLEEGITKQQGNKNQKDKQIRNVSINWQEQKKNNSNCDDNFSLAKSKILSELSSGQQDSEIVHIGYCCDKCQLDPIVGYRYHCQDCDDFDLCPKCYKSSSHEHNHNHEFTIFKEAQCAKRLSQSSNLRKQDFLFKNIRKSIRKK